jgi:hypothetical protein
MLVEEKGTLAFALDTKIEKNDKKGTLKLSQAAYTRSLLTEYNMLECEPRDTPAILTDITENDLPKTEHERKEAEKRPVRNLIGACGGLR